MLKRLGIAASVLLAAGVFAGETRAQLLHGDPPLPSFEVASIKPTSTTPGSTRFSGTDVRMIAHATAKELIANAYDAQITGQIEGGPGWINSDKFDVEAKIEDSFRERFKKMTHDQRNDQIHLMLQSLLAERFALKVSFATKQLPVFALVIAAKGSKLSATSSMPGHSSTDGGRGSLKGTNTPISMIAGELSRLPEIDGRQVIDETGLTGHYDWTLTWTPDAEGANYKSTDAANVQDAAPSIFTALQDELGLKLKSEKGPVEVLVIEHIERPSEN